MDFEIPGKISDVEIIAVGSKIRILPFLQQEFGRGRWRKLKGIAEVKLSNGEVRLAELHWARSAWNRQKILAYQALS